MSSAAHSLQAHDLLPYLWECGYVAANVEKNLELPDGLTVPLACFSQRPLDSRSACIVVLNATSSPEDVISACRGIGAPVALVCWSDRLQWWKLSHDAVSPFGPIILQKNVAGFFREHREDLSPKTIYRAKTLGRVDVSHQREFVDLGLMPAVENDSGKLIERLLLDQVATIRAELHWSKEITEGQGHWLMKSIFWLLGAKMLHDKRVENFIRMDFGNVENVFDRVGRHYGLSSEAVLTTDAQIAALQKAADAIGRVDLSLTTTEALAYVYENTLITKAVRKDLGTHSTPSYLIDYILGRLAAWIEQIPEDRRHVFEPACGHSGFLVSAVRLLTSLLPADKASPAERRAYLRDHIRGCDVDEFALEIARLSLTLTDIPNPNGWKLTRADAFASDILEKTAAQSMIVLSNPPFEAINKIPPEKRGEYAQNFRAPQFVNKAAEILHRTLSALPVGGVFGVVVPQTLLHGKDAAFRQMLVNQTEFDEICLFPDKVFNFADVESAILIGRKITGQAPLRQVGYRRVREGQMEGFKASYAVTSEVTVPQSRFQDAEKNDLRVPDLENIWAACAHLPKLSEFVDVGQGFSFIGEDQPDFPKGTQRTSPVPKPGFEEGFENLGKQVMTHCLPPTVHLNISEKITLADRSGKETGRPQILINEAPVQRVQWCVKGMIDRVGRVATTSFTILRPASAKITLPLLWAFVNSPLGNAYAYAHSSKWHILTGTWRKFPVPNLTLPMRDLNQAVENYFTAVHTFENGYHSEAGFSLDNEADLAEKKEALRVLHWRIDAEVLKLYKLPVELERQLLDYFAGHRRAGVPFEQDRYFPEGFDDDISLADYLAITADWEATNERRLELIDKKLDGTLTEEEKPELANLKRLARAKRHLVMPLPNKELKEREEDLKRRGLWRGA